MQTLKRFNNIQPVSIEEDGRHEFRLGEDELLSRHGQDIHAEGRYQIPFSCSLATAMLILLLVPIIVLVGSSLLFSLLMASELRDKVVYQAYLQAEAQVSSDISLKEALLRSCIGLVEEPLFYLYRDPSATANQVIISKEAYPWLMESFVSIYKANKLNIIIVTSQQTGDYLDVTTSASDIPPMYYDSSDNNVTIDLVPRNDADSSYGNLTMLVRMKDMTYKTFFTLPTFNYEPRERPFYLRVIRENYSIGMTRIYPQIIVSTNGGTVENKKAFQLIVVMSGPVFSRMNGMFLGVVGVGYDLSILSDLVKSLVISPKGYAFILQIERGGNSTLAIRTVIAYRDPDVLGVYDPKTDTSYPTTDDKISDRKLKKAVMSLPSNFDTLTSGYQTVLFRDRSVQYIAGFGPSKKTKNTNFPWIVVIVAPTSDFTKKVSTLTSINVASGILCTIAGVTLVVIFARSISRPLNYFSAESEALAKLEIKQKPIWKTYIYEIVKLNSAIEDMKTTLRSFKKFVPHELIKSMIESRSEAKLGGQTANLTIWFADLVEFTNLSERLQPEELIQHVSKYFHSVTEQIVENNGTLDKYIGDAVMALWGAPVKDEQGALKACIAALNSQKRMEEYKTLCISNSLPILECRIGINTGPAVVGYIGSHWRLNYTAIGDSVNLASRLEGLNKVYGTNIIISANTLKEPGVRESVIVRQLDTVSVKGKTEGVTIYELIGLSNDHIDNERIANGKAYEEGLEYYYKANFSDALTSFRKALSILPTDKPTQEMIRRCEHYSEDMPIHWTGVYEVKTK